LNEERIANLACAVIETVKNMYSGRREVLDSVRRRCKDLAGLLFTNGALLTLAHAYSKAGEDLVKEAYNRLEKSLSSVLVQPLLGKDEGELGYAFYAAFICMALKEMKAITNPALIEVIQALTSDRRPIYERHLLTMADWLRRLSDALLR